MTQLQQSEPEVYQGQFGKFTLTQSDAVGVVVYRTGLAVAALSFAVGTGLVLSQGSTPAVLRALTPLCPVLGGARC